MRLLAVGSAGTVEAVARAGARGAAVEHVADGDAALARLGADGDVDAIVLPADGDRLLPLLQRLRRIDGEVGVLVLCPPLGQRELQEALQLAPFARGEVLLRPPGAEALDEELLDLAGRTAQRRGHRRLVAAAQRRLAEAGPARLPAAAHLGHLLEHAPIGALVLATDGGMLGWNRLAADLLGLEEGHVGLPLSDRLPDDGRARLGDLLRSSRAHGPSIAVELGGRGIELSAARIEGDDGEPAVLVLASDVSERRRVQAERERAVTLLEAQYEIARALAEAAAVEEVAPRVLAAVCGSLDWELGAFWRVDRYARLLRFVDAWSLDAELERRFSDDSRGFMLGPAEGMLGTTWSGARTIWVEDLQRDRELTIRRRDFLGSLGLRAIFYVPVRAGAEVLGVLEFASRRPRSTDPELMAALEAAGAQVGQFLERAFVRERLRAAEEQRARLAGAVLAAEGEERARIASELHDDTIQVLIASMLQLDLLRRAVGDDPAATTRIVALRRTLEAATERARRLSFRLRPQVLDAQGLRAAVQDLLEETFEGTEVEVTLDALPGRLPWAVEELAFRTVAEAVANARTHAGARHLSVRLVERGGALEGEVADDGTGFDVARVLGRSRRRGHVGSDAMAERVRLAGGSIGIDSAPGQGTRVRFEIPLRAAAQRTRSDAPEALYAQAEEWTALLDTLLEAAPVGIGFWDTSFRFVRVNERLAEINGRSVDEHLGHTIGEVLPELSIVIEPLLQQVLETGRALVDDEISGETPARPGELRHWLASYYPVRGRRGEVLGIGAIVAEITDRKLAEQERQRLLAAERDARAQAEASRDRLAILARASTALTESLELAATVERVLSLVVPRLADWALLDLTEGPRLRAAGRRHAEPGHDEALRELQLHHAPAGANAARLRRGEPLMLDPGDASLGKDGIDAALAKLATRSLLLVPLVAAGTVVGVLTLGSTRRRYDGEDLEFADQLATRAALALENARLYEERSATARAMQQSLLPAALAELPGAEAAVRYRPLGRGTDVGGDFYDLFPVGIDEWGVAIGDVTGKGPQAAAVTGLVRHTLRAVARYRDAAGALEAVNDALLAERVDRYCTVAFGRVRPLAAGLAIELTLAGHPYPLVIRSDGHLERVGRTGPLLGAFSAPAISAERVDLAPGDAVVFYTDGVTEARRDGEQFGEPRLAAVAAACAGEPADVIAGRIEAAVLDFSPRPSDDVAILVLSTLGKR